MSLPAQTIKDLIQASFPDSTIELVALRDDDDHYAVTVTSKTFEGKSRIDQHRLVYEALQGKMGSALHALSIRTKIPSS